MKFAISNLFLALFATSAVVDAHDVRVGKKKPRAGKKEPRIVGGTPVAEGEFPYFAVFFCIVVSPKASASDHPLNSPYPSLLISPSFQSVSVTKEIVLTAAHCTPPPTPTIVHVGGTGRGNADGGGQFAKIVNIVNHPQWPGEAGGDQFDIALLYLDREIRPDTNIQIQVANFMPAVGTMLTVVGGGILWDDEADPNAVSDVIRKVTIPLVSNEQCNDPDWYDGGIQDANFCAGGGAGKAHCSGDSGGPIWLIDGNTHIQIGTVASSEGCGEVNLPGVYASTQSVFTWIQHHVCDKRFESVVCPGGGSSVSGAVVREVVLERWFGKWFGGVNFASDCYDFFMAIVMTVNIMKFT